MSGAPVRETVLLVLERQGELVPLSTDAFRLGQGSRKKLTSDYVGALVLWRSGEARRIERLEVLGPHGDGVGRRLVSVLTSAWRIAVSLSPPLDMKLDEIRELILRLLRVDQQRPEPYLPLPVEWPAAERAVREAASVEEVFRILRVPDPDDALDVL